jgi:hypothetical protein
LLARGLLRQPGRFAAHEGRPSAARRVSGGLSARRKSDENESGENAEASAQGHHHGEPTLRGAGRVVNPVTVLERRPRGGYPSQGSKGCPVTRESYIPVSKTALIDALAGGPGLPADDAARFAHLCRMLSAFIHHEAFDGLERLRELYRPLDPDAPHEQGADPAAFRAALETVLTRANFVEAPTSALFAGADVDTLNDVRIRTNHDGIAAIRFFTRGGQPETVVTRRFFGLSRREVTTETFDDVVVVVELKPAQSLDKTEERAFERLRRGARPGAMLIKHFGGVPQVVLPSLHLGAMPTMKRADQLVLGVPAIAGGAPLLIQLANALPIIFAVIAAYFGVQGAVTKDGLQKALAALSGIVALGAFLMRQRVKFDRQRLLYQRRLAETVYFHTIANNAGVLDGLVGAAEAQDAKESVLAWWVLRTQGPLAKRDLDLACEARLREMFGVDVDFEITDALGKLIRYGLVAERDGKLVAAPAIDGLKALDAAWDAAFASSVTS